jgi:hypothetical protein
MIPISITVDLAGDDLRLVPWLRGKTGPHFAYRALLRPWSTQNPLDIPERTSGTGKCHSVDLRTWHTYLTKARGPGIIWLGHFRDLSAPFVRAPLKLEFRDGRDLAQRWILGSPDATFRPEPLREPSRHTVIFLANGTCGSARRL